MLEYIQYLNVPLPEDIRKQKDAGYFSEVLALIEQRLEGKIPQALRKRLELERELLSVWEEEYPYSFDEALSILCENICYFTREEFLELIEAGMFDWIYRNGKMYFIRTFYENLLKVQHPITARLIVPEAPDEGEKKQKVLNENMHFMKVNGGTAYRIHIRTTLKIKEETAREGEQITVHLPIPNAGTQVRNIRIIAVPEGAIISPENFESRTACYRGILNKGQEFVVEYEYENHVTYMEPDSEKVDTIQPDFFLEEQAPHIMFTPYIQQLYQEVVGEEQNPLLKAKKIYDYITSEIRYSYVRKYSIIENIPEYAAINQKGDCGIQALLFITLCRYGSIPARWQSGLFAAPYDIGGHDWAQFYIAPYGWLFADLSFGGSSRRVGNEERRRFYFGNLDPFRMPANSAFQHEFQPAKKYMRKDPTDNQYGECEYEDRALRSSEYETKHEILEICQIPWEGSRK